MSDMGLGERVTPEYVAMPDDQLPVLAAIHYECDFDINATLREVVKKLQRVGVKVGGILQEAEFVPNECCARLHVVDIRTGQSERITQDRGPEARGCKLDPRGLAAISHCITDAIRTDSDLIIINKFGRAESEGGGLLSCIAGTVTAGIPLLTTVREPYVAQWTVFHGGLATALRPQPDAVLQWFGRWRSGKLSDIAMVA